MEASRQVGGLDTLGDKFTAFISGEAERLALRGIQKKIRHQWDSSLPGPKTMHFSFSFQFIIQDVVQTAETESSQPKCVLKAGKETQFVEDFRSMHKAGVWIPSTM